MNSLMMQVSVDVCQVVDGTDCPFGPQAGPGSSMFAYLGVSASIVFSCLGAAYGTARAGAGLASMGVMYPTVVMRCMIPIVMAGVLGIYGLIISVILLQNVKGVTTGDFTAFNAYAQLGAGLSVGLSSLGMSTLYLYPY